MDAGKPQTIDEYIAQCPAEVQERLRTLRAAIAAVEPEATEAISWGMPTFKLHGNLIHFAAFRQHIGLYPGAEGVEHFLPRLGAYHTSKGAIQFPHGEPLPLELIAEIVRFRAAQNRQWAAEKTAKKAAKRKG